MDDLRTRAEMATSEKGEALRDIQAGERITFTPARGGEPSEALADVDESPNAAREDVPVHEAWQAMMRDVQWLAKDRRTTDGARYTYRGIDDVMNLVGPALRKHRVFVMPTGIKPDFTVINTKSGAAMNYCRAEVHFTIYGPKGDSMQAVVFGEGFDNGDKSSSKAQSVALRTLYLNGLAIQTNEPARDTEYGVQHELAGPPRPTAAQYEAEIMNENTTINRLQQIKALLDADPAMAHTQVETMDGTMIELGRLVRRVGAARLSTKSGS